MAPDLLVFWIINIAEEPIPASAEELLEKLAKQATMPVTVVLDNARYQRCSLVQRTAKRLGIELLFLPIHPTSI